jgi:hypothetical protein
MRPPSLAKLQKQCDDWNARYPIGTQVQYHFVIDGPEYRLRTTRTEARILSGHTAVVWLDGESGCVCLEACKAIHVGIPGRKS